MTTQPITDNPDILSLLPRVQDSDASTRRIALIELADLEDPDALPWLTHALTTDDNADVRREAARLLEGWEEEEVVEALSNALTDVDESVSEIAAQSLSQLKTAELGHIILRWVKHDNAEVRKHAWRALRELRLPASAPAALNALHDENANVRREAVGVLGWLKYTDALPELARLTSNDTAIEVRRAATGALGLANNDSV
jgi:HEAT repeat protein